MKASIKNELKSGLREILALIRNTRARSLASDISLYQATNDFVAVEHNGYMLWF